jgi:hypothetical protein
MHLKREALLCIEQLAKQREPGAIWKPGSENGLSMLCPEFMEGTPPERAFVHHALRFFTVDQLPRLSDPGTVRKALPKKGLEPATTPHSFHEQGLENQWAG